MTYTFKYQSPLGGIMLASNGEALPGYGFMDKNISEILYLKNMKKENYQFLMKQRDGLIIIFKAKNRILHLRYYLKQRHFEKWFGKF